MAHEYGSASKSTAESVLGSRVLQPGLQQRQHLTTYLPLLAIDVVGLLSNDNGGVDTSLFVFGASGPVG